MATTTTKKQPDTNHNTELAGIFHQMASCYRYLGARQRFRVIAYDNASRTLNGLKDDISNYATDVKTLDKLHGIGESIGSKILEYLQTGQIATFERLKQRVPPGLIPLMDVNGFGPATVKTLHKKLGISNQDEMIAAIESGRLERLKGFGPKKIDNMRKGLKLFAGQHGRIAAHHPAGDFGTNPKMRRRFPLPHKIVRHNSAAAE